jgi:hypothetical protein
MSYFRKKIFNFLDDLIRQRDIRRIRNHMVDKGLLEPLLSDVIMEFVIKITKRIFLFIIASIGLMSSWNCIMPKFHIPEISFIDAAMLNCLVFHILLIPILLIKEKNPQPKN